MSACEFLGSNVDFYVPLVLKRADLFLAADLFLESLDKQDSFLLFSRVSKIQVLKTLALSSRYFEFYTYFRIFKSHKKLYHTLLTLLR